MNLQSNYLVYKGLTYAYWGNGLLGQLKCTLFVSSEWENKS